MLPHKQIELRLQAAVQAVLPDADVSAVLLHPCPDAKFGDYQCNALMSLAKARKTNPRRLATDVLVKFDVSDFCEQVEAGGPGFLNFRLKARAVRASLQAAALGGPLLFDKATPPRTIVIDFSSPNVAKPMHVGHIRSTILGDCLARVLRLLGHHVVTDNHIGDWGTQFGMLLLGWQDHLDRAALARDPLGEMERLYRKVNAECDANPARLEAARRALVKLQAGDAENIAIWREMVRLSQVQFDEIYSRLGVTFDYTFGESYYNPLLGAVVADFLNCRIARESEGAIVIFFDDIPQLQQHPLIIRKSDGGFNYASTDLATLAFRLKSWHPDEIIYVTDGRQQLHFQQVFAAFRKWQAAPSRGWVAQASDITSETPNFQAALAPGLAGVLPPTEGIRKLSHVWFGSILGEDGKPFQTRRGDSVKLSALLDEAEQRAFKIVSEKNPELPEPRRREIARVVGIGAVKYADLLPNRQGDYVFSWDKLLALNGNTAPYLLYAYARIRSIFRKATEIPPATPKPSEGGQIEIQPSNFVLAAAEEIALAKHLLNFGLTLEAVVAEWRPNFLCNFLYDLAGKFTAFYENCPVLKAEGPMRVSRLALCDLTARVLKQGLESLGIETLEQM